MQKFNKLFLLILTLSFFGFYSCSSDDDNKKDNRTGSQYLSDKNWITTKVINELGVDVTTTDPAAMNYVGYAYYRTDGTFRIVSLEDAPKMFGLWKLTDNDTKRVLDVYKSDNTIAYTRAVDITELNGSIFTYKIVPNAADISKYYIVEHKPTDHKEPLTPAQILSSVDWWVTTKVWNITNPNAPVEMDMTVAPAANYAGNAYYVNLHGSEYFPKQGDAYVNGTFKITTFDNETVRSQGDWYVSLDGKTRTLYAKDADGKLLWNRVVNIYELTAKKFIYDITQDGVSMRVEHELVVKE